MAGAIATIDCPDLLDKCGRDGLCILVIRRKNRQLAIFERFVARHVSINGFTQLRLHSTARGDILNGRPRCGNRPIL